MLRPLGRLPSPRVHHTVSFSTEPVILKTLFLTKNRVRDVFRALITPQAHVLRTLPQCRSSCLKFAHCSRPNMANSAYAGPRSVRLRLAAQGRRKVCFRQSSDLDCACSNSLASLAGLRPPNAPRPDLLCRDHACVQRKCITENPSVGVALRSVMILGGKEVSIPSEVCTALPARIGAQLPECPCRSTPASLYRELRPHPPELLRSRAPRADAIRGTRTEAELHILIKSRGTSHHSVRLALP